MYKKQYQNGGVIVQHSPIRQQDAGYSTITYPNGIHYVPHPATGMSTPTHTGWGSLSTQDKVTM